jgi:hypothetical protein
MNIVPLTLTVSLTLAFSFVAFFLAQQKRGGGKRDPLLQLADESRSSRSPLGVRTHGV